MKSKIVIGDVHGQFEALMQLLAKLPHGFPKEDICFSGDLIDRGEFNREVVEFVIQQGFEVSKGNHEDFMVKFGVSRDADYWTHAQNGGAATLGQYDIHSEDGAKVFQEHKDWMKELPLYLEYNDVVDEKGQHLVVSHSSAASTWRCRDPKNGNHDFFRHNVLRERDMNPKDIPEIYNIFGHTPQENEPRIRDGWACIDGGGFVTWIPGHAKLYALQFPEMTLYEQKVTNTAHEDRLRKAGII